MKVIRDSLFLLFFVATGLGLISLIPIALDQTLWVLYPFAIAFCGFVTYFLGKVRI